MKKYEKQLKALSKDSNPNAEEWRAQACEQTETAHQSDGTKAKLRKAVIITALPLLLVICCLAVFLFIVLNKPIAPIQVEEFGEDDLAYSAMTLAEVQEQCLSLPDITRLKELTFKAAYILKTGQLAFINISGIYESETQYTEYGIIVLLMNNVKFSRRSMYESSCKESVAVNEYSFLYCKNVKIDDTFFNSMAYGSIQATKYYIDILSLFEISPHDSLALLFP